MYVNIKDTMLKYVSIYDLKNNVVYTRKYVVELKIEVSGQR